MYILKLQIYKSLTHCLCRKTARISAHIHRFPPNLDHRYLPVGLITNLLNPVGVVIMTKVDTIALAGAPSQQSDHITVILNRLHRFGPL